MRNFKRRHKNAKEPSMKIYVRKNDINGAIRILKKKLMTTPTKTINTLKNLE